MRRITYLVVCALMWTCGSNPDEREKQELILYNDITDQLAWQIADACTRAGGLKAIIWSDRHADSVKNLMRTKNDRNGIYYQARIGAARKITGLSDWLVVEISSWDRFYSTFPGTTPKRVLESIAISSALEAGALHVDYLNVVNLDTASLALPDSSMAVIRFSKPYFNEDTNRAVVYLESACGTKSARGELLMVRYKTNRWLIEERRQVWIR